MMTVGYIYNSQFICYYFLISHCNLLVEKGSEAKEKKKFVDSICLPLVSVFPKKKKDEQNLENQAAGLASVETLEDNDKSADKNDDVKNISINVCIYLLYEEN